MRLSTMARAY
jgi:hypothetical protein